MQRLFSVRRSFSPAIIYPHLRVRRVADKVLVRTLFDMSRNKFLFHK